MNNVHRKKTKKLAFKFFLSLCILALFTLNLNLLASSKKELTMEEENRRAGDYIMVLIYGNAWKARPTDQEISNAFQGLPATLDDSDQYSTMIFSYSYGNPRKVHITEIDSNNEFASRSNQVLVIVYVNYFSQSKLLKNDPGYTSNSVTYTLLGQEDNGQFRFGETTYGNLEANPESFQGPENGGSLVYSSGWIDPTLPSVSEPIIEPSTPIPGDSEGEIPWVAVVGGSAAVGAAAVILAKNAMKKGKKTSENTNRPQSNQTLQKTELKKDKEKEEKPVGYIIQLTEEQILLTEGTSVMVGIRVVEVDARGNWKLAPSAEIQLKLGLDTKLSVVPVVGTNVLNATISQKESVTTETLETIDVAASSKGQTMTASIKVEMKPTWRMVFR